MSDPALREFNELKREVVEARNQSIKTDNQIKNLSLDMKGFETRFDNLEKRARFATIGAYAIVAVTISIAAYFISSISIFSALFSTKIILPLSTASSIKVEKQLWNFFSSYSN